MDRNIRTAVVVGVAFVLAATASYGIYRVVSRVSEKSAGPPTVEVVVAEHALPLGTRVTSDHVRLVHWPADNQVPGTFSKLEDVINRGVIIPVAQNEPLTDAKLAPLEAGAGLPPSIPPGMRAVSVKVNEVIGVAGFVVPGTRVDVMVTLNGHRSDDSMTRVVVSNVQVLTAGTRYDQEKAKDGAANTIHGRDPAGDSGGWRAHRARGEPKDKSCWRCATRWTRQPTATSGIRTAALFGQPAPTPPSRSRAAPPAH